MTFILCGIAIVLLVAGIVVVWDGSDTSFQMMPESPSHTATRARRTRLRAIARYRSSKAHQDGSVQAETDVSPRTPRFIHSSTGGPQKGDQ